MDGRHLGSSHACEQVFVLVGEMLHGRVYLGLCLSVGDYAGFDEVGLEFRRDAPDGFRSA